MQIAIQYEIYHCKIHKRYIHYFAGSRLGQETMCWDCVKEANDKKLKEELQRCRARDEFVLQFAHLWTDNLLGGISSVSITKTGIHVEIESSDEAFRQVPDIYMKYRVDKQIIGEPE